MPFSTPFTNTPTKNGMAMTAVIGHRLMLSKTHWQRSRTSPWFAGLVFGYKWCHGYITS